MSRRPLACLALLAALLPGCAGRDYRPGDKPVTAHWPGKDSCFNLAPYPGEYVLLRTGESAPVEVRELPGGATVGFEVRPDGSLAAVADDQVIPLPEGDYRWNVARVSRWQLARLTMREAGDAAEPVADALCVVGVAVLLLGGLLLFTSLLPPDSVHP